MDLEGDRLPIQLHPLGEHQFGAVLILTDEPPCEKSDCQRRLAHTSTSGNHHPDLPLDIGRPLRSCRKQASSTFPRHHPSGPPIINHQSKICQSSQVTKAMTDQRSRHHPSGPPITKPPEKNLP